MRTHAWHLPRLGCALQGLLPLLPPTPDAPAGSSSYPIHPQQVPIDCHLLDDNRSGNTHRNIKILTEITNNPLSFNR